MPQSKALSHLAALPYTFSPSLLRDAHLHRITALCTQYQLNCDDVVDFMKSGQPSRSAASIAPFILLHVAGVWALPCVRFGDALAPGGKQRERSSTEAAQQFLSAAITAMAQHPGMIHPTCIADIYATAAEIADLLNDSSSTVKHLNLAVAPILPVTYGEQPIHESLLSRILALMAKVGVKSASWLPFLKRGLTSTASHHACTALLKGGGVGLLARSLDGPKWRLAASDIGFALLSQNVITDSEFLVTLRESAYAEGVRGGEEGEREELLIALLGLVAQNCLTGWVHYDEPEGGVGGGGGGGGSVVEALARLLYRRSEEDFDVVFAHLEGLGGETTVGSTPQPMTAPRLPQKRDEAMHVLLLGAGRQERWNGPSSAVDDKVLSSFYDTNPYPVWVRVGTAGLPVFTSYLAYLRRYLPLKASASLSWPEADEKLLVAGCGSGHQVALALAQYTSTALVKGIDLSGVNLAYAQGRLTATTPATQRWTLAQEDLTDVVPTASEEYERYDVVECCGVLHHCKEPGTALKALVRRMKKGGVMQLGVYSAGGTERVRECISFLQEKYHLHDSAGVSAERIREVREAVDALPSSNPARQVLQSQLSYYAAAPFRDMLCHPRAHYFSLEELRVLTKAAGLRLLAMTFDSCGADIAARLAYSGKTQQDEVMASWDTWRHVEGQINTQSLPWHNMLLVKE